MRPIDADALEKDANEDLLSDTDTVEEVYWYWNDGAKSIIDLIKTAPTIDAVPVVRCKYCIHKPTHKKNARGNFFIVAPDDICPYLCDDPWYDRVPEDDWYCSKGERSEE